ncbi:hypothetical protein A3306_05915 [Rickettsia bellii]|uniref:Uncharacterized protein n=1 Tax=Rickettsia bellii str. RML An4 TaxID=1359193 RepID=A0A0F3QAQ7_RICBE|nr:hypothetical protein [Rickettsia bellii]ARD86671.1 hypothetical protein A3306_05915 [Rickettsia bellii]KJV89655.1 hypothetical protein RBEAN4_0634 [Rickettsia bellii str. RML An4]
MIENLKADDRVQEMEDIIDIQEKDLNIDDPAQQLPKKDLADKKINEIEETKNLKIDDQNQQLSNRNVVNGKINDITGVIRKFNQYQSLVPKDLSFFDQPLQYVQNFGGALDLGYDLIRSYLKEEKIQDFVDSINENAKQNAAITTKQNRDKIKLYAAKIEANLKGFRPGLDLESMKLVLNEFNDQDISTLTNAINESLVEVSNNKIPAKGYTEKLLEAVTKKLSNSFSQQKLQQCKEFIQSGQKNKKTYTESEMDRKEISKAAEDSINQLTERLDKNTRKSKALEPVVKLFSSLYESANEKLIEKTGAILKNLDSAYLTENSPKIVSELKEINDKGTSLWEKFKSIFTGKDYLEERLEQSVNKYAALSDEHVKKEIDNKIFSNALTNEQIAVGLTKLMNKTVEPKEVNNPNLNLVEIRKANPEIFDKLLFANQSQTSSKDKPDIHQENQKVRTRGPGL